MQKALKEHLGRGVLPSGAELQGAPPPHFPCLVFFKGSLEKGSLGA